MLPDNIKIRWTYSKRISRGDGTRKKCAQTNQVLETVFKKGFSLAKRFANSHVGKALAREALEEAPKCYKKATCKIKNKKLHKALHSDFANTALDLGRTQ